MKSIPFELLLAVVATAAKARAARAGTEGQACDCPGCKFKAATEKLLAARKAEAKACDEAEKARILAQEANRKLNDARDAMHLASEELNAAADALNAEDAKAEGGAQ